MPKNWLYLLNSISESNSHVAHVKHTVVFANEDIAQNPPGSHGQFQSHKTRNALSLPKLSYLRKDYQWDLILVITFQQRLPSKCSLFRSNQSLFRQCWRSQWAKSRWCRSSRCIDRFREGFPEIFLRFCQNPEEIFVWKLLALAPKSESYRKSKQNPITTTAAANTLDFTVFVGWNMVKIVEINQFSLQFLQ